MCDRDLEPDGHVVPIGEDKQVIEQLAHGFRRRRDVQGVTRRVLAAADPVLILPDPTCPVPVAGILVIAHEKAVNLQNVGELHLDRKSTRLNSSHVASSYGVFCLKKT